MKILIIGSKGFIGSHALDYFRTQYPEVYGCDVVSDYVDKRYYTIDSSSSHYDTCFKAVAFDVCINCSGAASVPDSLKNPLRDFYLNTKNVFSILDSIRRLNPQCKFINLSSAAVYGNPEHLPVNEEQALQPVSPYGRHKLMAEEICREFYEYFDIQTLSLRIFSAYGPGLKKQLLWDLYQKSKAASVELFGTGEETRDFIYIDDVIQAIELVIAKAVFDGGAINLANGNQVKIKNLVHCYFDTLAYQGVVDFKGQNRKGDPLCWEADISTLKALGYERRISLEQGIQNYIEWVQREE